METPVPYTAGTVTPTMPPRGFVEVRTQRGRLIFRYDARRQLIEWREGKECELIDLTQYE